MASIEPFDTTELLRFRYDLDIPAFVQAAVRHNLNKEEVLVYLQIITNIHDEEIAETRRFVPIARGKALNRNEILVWLHISHGGRLDPKHLSRKLRIPPRFAKKALAGLEKKGIIREGRVF